MYVVIVVLIIIWMMVGFHWINWVIGLFFTVLVIVILYGFSILYRIHFQNYLRSRNKVIQNQSTIAQQSFENSIAYWPQGLFAAACAVTCDGTTGCWSCNENDDCPPCNGVRPSRIRQSSRVCGSPRVEEEDDDEEDEPPRRVRGRRVQRRKARGTQ